MARTTRGSIFKRGKYYWLQYSINKERIRIPLKNDKGESITTVAEARIAADKILSVIRTKDEAQRSRANWIMRKKRKHRPGRTWKIPWL